MTATADRISELLALGKIGTSVRIVRDGGQIVSDTLFFEVKERAIHWNHSRSQLRLSAYVLVLPGKVTGMLLSVPQVQHCDDAICLGIVSQRAVLEVVFGSEVEQQIWRKGLQLLISQPQLQQTMAMAQTPTHTPSTSLLKTRNSITGSASNSKSISKRMSTANARRRSIEIGTETETEANEAIVEFYPFLMRSLNGCTFRRLAEQRDSSGKGKMEAEMVEDGGGEGQATIQLQLSSECDALICTQEKRPLAATAINEIRIDRHLHIHREDVKFVMRFSNNGKQDNAEAEAEGVRLRVSCRDEEQRRMWMSGLAFLRKAEHQRQVREMLQQRTLRRQRLKLQL